MSASCTSGTVLLSIAVFFYNYLKGGVCVPAFSKDDYEVATVEGSEMATDTPLMLRRGELEIPSYLNSNLFLTEKILRQHRIIPHPDNQI